MRTVTVFVAGILVGVAVQAGVAQQSRRLVGLNHVVFNVPNLDEAVKFYTKTFGLKQAFTVSDPVGAPALTYLQISGDSFIELLPATPARPAGFSHFGLQVDDIGAAVPQFRQAGLKVQEPTLSERTHARLAQATDANGNRIELLEFGPESSQRKAMDAWTPAASGAGGVPTIVDYVPNDKVAATMAKGGPIINDHGLVVLAQRRAAGEVEVHEKTNHVFIIVEGEATFVTGGMLVSPRETAPGQRRAPSVEGGEVHHLKKGDVITIPAKTPHWFKEVPSQTIAYYAVNMEQ